MGSSLVLSEKSQSALAPSRLGARGEILDGAPEPTASAASVGSFQRVDGPVVKVGDARDLSILGLAPASVDCVVTSPPYWHLKDYGDDRREIGHQQSKGDYFDAVGDVFEQCFALTKPTGVMWLVIDTLRDPVPGGGELLPLPFELADIAREKGWRLQDLAIWEKNKTLPYSGAGKLRNLIEYVLFMTKSVEFKHRPYRCAERHRPGAEWLAGWPERYHPLGKRPSNAWKFDIDTQGMWDHSSGLHACPFPQGLVARIIDLTTDRGDIVLDPFAGIGTVPAQAAAMGRRGYGVELSPKHVKIFEDDVLPGFLADWEKNAERRALARQDQIDEALTILRLRLLKAGKEMMRLVERLATERTDKHPAGEIESVLVLEPGKLEQAVKLDEGTVDRVPARILLIGDLPKAQAKRLIDELTTSLDAPPFSTFGLDISLEVAGWSSLVKSGIAVSAQEFGQSRHGAFTSPLEAGDDARPKLLTTVTLPAPVQGNRTSALEEAKNETERRVLAKAIASGDDLSTISERLGIPRADLHRLLVDHELVDKPSSFAIPLPNGTALS
jgi:DNA modification methylase